MTTLGDELPKEIERCQELVKRYEALGPVGIFGATSIGFVIKTAQSAMSQGDTVAMIKAYQMLKECE